MNYAYEPEAPFAAEGQPLYFVRRYVGPPERPGVFSLVAPGETLMIYGYSFRLTGSDAAVAQDAWKRHRRFMAWCSSAREPGEMGFVPLDDVEEITREQYEAAAEAGWPT